MNSWMRGTGRAMRGGVAQFLLGLGLTRPERVGRGRLTVATFHRVLPPDALREYPLPHLAVTIAEFDWLVAFFARHYTCGPLAAMHRRWVDGERPARPFLAVTFDDGQLDNFLHARPVLDRAGIGASFFVPVDAVGGNTTLWHDRLGFAALRLLRTDRARAQEILGLVAGPDAGSLELIHAAIQRAKRLSPAHRLAEVARVEAASGGAGRPAWDGVMNWEQLRELARGGHEIGSHSQSHPILTLLDDADLEREIAGSRRRIEQEVGTPCESFCYPNGSLDPRVVDAVRDAGYRRAVTTAPGPNDPGADPFRLTRSELQGRHATSEARTAYQLSPYPGRRPG